MKVYKQIYVVFILVSFVILTGCGMFSLESKNTKSSEKSDNNKPVTVDDQLPSSAEIVKLKSDLLKLKNERLSLEEKIEKDKKSILPLQVKCDEKTKGKQGADLKEAQESEDCKTLSQKKKDLNIDSDQERKKDLDTRIATITEQIRQYELAKKNQDESNWGFLYWIIVAIVSLFIFVGLCLLLYYIFSNFKKNREEISNNFKALRSKQDQLKSEIESLKSSVSYLKGQIKQNQATPKPSQKAFQSERFAPSIEHQNYQPNTPKPEFPVSAEDYISKVGTDSIIGTVDSFTGNIVEDSTKNNEFLIYTNGSISYAIPYLTRFNTRSNYYDFYQNFYHCERPSGGEVWIKSPARVQKSSGGWQLIEMGELEVK